MDFSWRKWCNFFNFSFLFLVEVVLYYLKKKTLEVTMTTKRKLYRVYFKCKKVQFKCSY